MKIVVIGDIHGSKKWKKIVEKEENADKIIFIGDYFDSFDFKPIEQIENYKNIHEYKLNNPAKVELLIGNHDFHYMSGIEDEYSGYNREVAYQYNELIQNSLNENFLKICHVEDKFMFTHAGVSKTWLESVDIENDENIVDNINELFKYQPRKFGFTVGSTYSPYGNDKEQTPLWIRPLALEGDAIEGYTHVVGHTQHVSIKDYMTKYKRSINVDVLPMSEYLVIDGGEVIVKDI